MPFFGEVMPRDLFCPILSCLLLSDNDDYVPRGQEGYDPLKKLGNFYPNLQERFLNAWSPGQDLSIDEGTIPFRGNSHFRVYNPMKPHKYGFKTYQLCDSSNGYCSRIELYTGTQC